MRVYRRVGPAARSAALVNPGEGTAEVDLEVPMTDAEGRRVRSVRLPPLSGALLRR